MGRAHLTAPAVFIISDFEILERSKGKRWLKVSFYRVGGFSRTDLWSEMATSWTGSGRMTIYSASVVRSLCKERQGYTWRYTVRFMIN